MFIPYLLWYRLTSITEKKKKKRTTRFSIMVYNSWQVTSIKNTVSLFTHLIRKLEIERKGQERMMSPKRKYSNSLTVCLLFLKDSLDLKCPWWLALGKTNPPWAGVHGINGYTQNLNSLPSQMRAVLLHERQWVCALNEICILGAWF